MQKKKPFFQREPNRRAVFISLWVAFILIIVDMLDIAVKQTLSGLSLMTDVQIPEYSMQLFGRVVAAVAIAIIITKKFRYLEGE